VNCALLRCLDLLPRSLDQLLRSLDQLLRNLPGKRSEKVMIQTAHRAAEEQTQMIRIHKKLLDFYKKLL